MKKWFSALLTIALVAVIATALPLAAQATEYTGTCGADGDNISWYLDTANGVLQLTGSGAMADYVSASSNRNPFYARRNNITSIEIGEGITYLGNYGFYYLIKATSVSIPSSVTSLGTNTFLNCRLLQSITLPEGVTEIPEAMAKGCSALTSCVYPSTLQSIGANAFYGALFTEITIPASVQTIGDSAFQSCSSATSLTLNEGLSSIGSMAFGYTSITSVDIPASVTSVAYNAFSGNSLLTDLTVNDNNLTYADNGGMLYTKALDTLLFCPQGITSAVEIYNGCSIIGEYAFNNTQVSAITIPSTVTTLKYGCFQSCSGITELTIPYSVTVIENEVCANSINLVTVNLDANVTQTGWYMFAGCSALTTANLAENITQYNEGTFNYCSVLANVTIPPTLTEIPKQCFNSCFALTQFEIPSTVTSIGEHAFYGCTGLTSIVIPEACTFIGDSGFSNCTGLTSFIFPASITEISANVLQRCTGLLTIDVLGNITSIGNGAFYNCTGLEYVKFHCDVPAYVGQNVVRNIPATALIYYPGEYTSWGQNKPFDFVTQYTSLLYTYVPYYDRAVVEITAVELRARATDDGNADMRFVATVYPHEGYTIDRCYFIVSVPELGTEAFVNASKVYSVDSVTGYYQVTCVIKCIRSANFGYSISTQCFIEYSGTENGTYASSVVAQSVNGLLG